MNVVEIPHLNLRRSSPLNERAVVVVAGKDRPSVLRTLFDVCRESCCGPEEAFERPFFVCYNPLLASCLWCGIVGCIRDLIWPPPDQLIVIVVSVWDRAVWKSPPGGLLDDALLSFPFSLRLAIMSACTRE